MLTDGTAAAAIEIMTNSTFFLNAIGVGGDCGFVRLQWVDAGGGFGRHAVSQSPSHNSHFDRGRLRAGA